MRLLLVLSCLGFVACVKREPPPTLVDPQREHPAMALTSLDFTLNKYPDQTAFKLSSLRGSVVLIDIWATWCDPCRDAMPMYQDLQKEFGAKGFKVLALNVDADASQIPKFLTETKLDLDILLDPNAAYAESTLKVKVMPTALLVDRQGRVRQVHEGFAEDFLAVYLKEVQELLDEPLEPKK
ncbi:MAG: TlpA family protein disulfide reductase [Myxococcaceae bacterium]|nr:TlpA family protein disulfide reductase [Myxococcaceae bacterium]